jgi:hypothetical protein
LITFRVIPNEPTGRPNGWKSERAIETTESTTRTHAVSNRSLV